MASLVNGFNVGRDKVRVGMIRFSHHSEVAFALNEYERRSDVVVAIEKQIWMQSDTYTFKALDQARDTLFQTLNGMRYVRGRQNLCVLIDEKSSLHSCFYLERAWKERNVLQDCLSWCVSET